MNEDQLAFVNLHLKWFHLVEARLLRRLTDVEVSQIIGIWVNAGMLQQEALQSAIMQATEEFIESMLTVDENDTEWLAGQE